MGGTEAFVPGDWVLDFMELSAAIATIDLERERRYRLSQIERQKQDFGLDVPESEMQKLQATLGSRGIEEDHRSAGATTSASPWLRRLFRWRHYGGSERT